MAKVADESVGGGAADAGTHPALWVLTVALIGDWAPTAVQSALRAAWFFVAACLAYYLWAAAVQGFSVGRDAALWGVLAGFAAPVAAVAVRHCAGPADVLGGAGLAAVTTLVLADGVLTQLYWPGREVLLAGFPSGRPGDDRRAPAATTPGRGCGR
ncbi:hypothetical protein ABT297_00240 [Dactylosporangium sp. NPDC000555]|uniref:hypothetical protein n=1 Tax=Dactylosporangium sp. NPDC000555 TaxID=3154260 RepID=UPI0033225FBF